eukprot:3543-Heterococcus_DN1.PRE.6
MRSKTTTTLLVASCHFVSKHAHVYIHTSSNLNTLPHVAAALLALIMRACCCVVTVHFGSTLTSWVRGAHRHSSAALHRHCAVIVAEGGTACSCILTSSIQNETSSTHQTPTSKPGCVRASPLGESVYCEEHTETLREH